MSKMNKKSSLYLIEEIKDSMPIEEAFRKAL